MAHFTVLSLGSRGDVAPYLALGEGLVEAGHHVRIITSPDFERETRGKGLDFHPIRGDMRGLLSGPSGLRLTESGGSVVRMSYSLLRMFGRLGSEIADDLTSDRLLDTDLIINQLPGGLYGFDLAEKAGVPMVMAAVMPLTPTRQTPMLAFPSWPGVIPGYNTLTHWLAYQIAWQMMRPAINRWRGDGLGLKRLPFLGIWRRLQQEKVPVLNAYSPHLAPRPPDWGDHIHVTGTWFEKDPDWEAPDPLKRFIEAGRPPVYIGFGSMPVRDPNSTLRLIMDALCRVGRRAILQSGWSGIERSGFPENVFLADVVPHDWLFPRMAAVVHHGGSGTTAAGVRAGVPSILTPFVFDQFFWGRCISQLGAGPVPIPHRRLTANRLADAIALSVSSPSMRERAAALGEQVRSEEGVQVAVRLLEEFAAHPASWP